jgi:hypothetical protein
MEDQTTGAPALPTFDTLARDVAPPSSEGSAAPADVAQRNQWFDDPSVFARVEQAVTDDEREGIDRIQQKLPTVALGQVEHRLRAIAMRYQEDAKITADLKAGMLGQVGADAARAKLNDEQTKALAAIDADADTASDALANYFAASGFPALTADESAAFGLIAARFPLMRSVDFMSETFEALKVATDPKAKNEARLRANKSLESIYLPLVRRRADHNTVEPHARQHIAGYSQLQSAIETHLATTLGTRQARMARNVAETIRDEIKTASAFVRKQRKFDVTILTTGSPHLFKHLDPRHQRNG